MRSSRALVIEHMGRVGEAKKGRAMFDALTSAELQGLVDKLDRAIDKSHNVAKSLPTSEERLRGLHTTDDLLDLFLDVYPAWCAALT